MAQKSTNSPAEHLFDIDVSVSRITLDNERRAKVDFEIHYRGEQAPASVDARLMVNPKRSWLQSLMFWRPAEKLDLQADLGWLELTGPKLRDSLTGQDKSARLTVLIHGITADVQPGDYAFRLELFDEQERVLEQSQPVIIQVESQPFNIKVMDPAVPSFTLRANRKKECQFQVNNTSGKPLQGRVRLNPRELKTPARLFTPKGRTPDITWFTINDTTEQSYPFPDKVGQPYKVSLAVPRTARAGVYQFSLDAADAENPDENFTAGPVVTFTIPAFPWALVITLAVLLLLVGGLWMLRRPNLEVNTNLGVVLSQTVTTGTPAVVTGTPAVAAGTAAVTAGTQAVTAGTQAVTIETLAIAADTPVIAAGTPAAGIETLAIPIGTPVVAAGAPVTAAETQTDSAGCPIDTASIPASPAGCSLSYTVTVTNMKGLLGRRDAVSRDVVLVDTLSDGAKFVAPYPDGCTALANSVTCTLPEDERIRQGRSFSFPLHIQIDPTQSKALTHTLRLGKQPPAEYALDITRKSNLKFYWLDNPETGKQDDELTYRLRVVNEGPSLSDPVSLKFEPFLPLTGSQYASLRSLSVQTEACSAGKWVECHWKNLAPQESREVILTTIPGPDTSGVISNTVTLTDGTSTYTETSELSVAASHGLAVVLTTEQTGTTSETGVPLIYSIGITNKMPFTANNVQVDFRVPDLLGDSIKLRNNNPEVCWINIKPLADDSQEYWVHCIFDELQTGKVQTLQVETTPSVEGVFDSYVLVDSEGFKSQASVSTNIARKAEFALRLDGSTPLSVASLKDEVLSQLNNNFQAEVRFYYDGTTEGRILGIGDQQGSDGIWSPGWSISIQKRLLVLQFHQENQQYIANCILDTPANDLAKWLNVTMTVDATLNVTGEAQAGDKKFPCSSFLLNKIAYTSPDLIVGGSNGSGGVNYQGAVGHVRLKTIGSTIWNLGNWEFGSANGNPVILDSSEYQQNATLPAGTWAWVPAQSTVLMPVRITSNSTWKANFIGISGWPAPEFKEDNSWIYAWDMPFTAGWAQQPTPALRWIWAAQPYSNAFSHSCSVGIVFSQTTIYCGGFPADGTAYLRKTIQLPGNPVVATAQIAADNVFTIFTNGVVQGSCAAGNCYSEVKEYRLTNLHEGDNTIAIQAANFGGPAGVLVTIDIDFYPTLTIR